MQTTPSDPMEGDHQPATSVAAAAGPALIAFRSYQLPVFLDRTTGVVVLHWSRQIGKSYTLAAWAVDRLLTQLQRYPGWLVTVLSNSRDNGGEFVLKCAEICRTLGLVVSGATRPPQKRTARDGSPELAAAYALEDESPDIRYENMRMEVRIQFGERLGRIKVLAANPRTARGFSGDLILDEFAFHENGSAIWEAAEPILSANPEFLCRVASTGNGKYNLFYRMATGGQLKVIRVSRTDAWRLGVRIFDPSTRRPISPEEARAQALDKRAYDQNYELAFADENLALLTNELISAAERATTPTIGLEEQQWTPATLERLREVPAPLFVGHDVGRHRDLSVVKVLLRDGPVHQVAALLRMQGLRLPAQQAHLDLVCALPRFARYVGDMTGLGLGLVEYLQEKWGCDRVQGVNFAHVERIAGGARGDGRPPETARVTEVLATRLLELFEARLIEIPVDPQLRDDLRKPEKITAPGGRVSIAATRDEAGHADHFWSLALAVRAAAMAPAVWPLRVCQTRMARAAARRRDRSVPW